MDSSGSVLNPADKAGSGENERLILKAFVEIRKELLVLERRPVGGNYRFLLESDDHFGWPRLVVKLFAKGSSHPEVPSLQVHADDRQGKALIEIQYQSNGEPVKLSMLEEDSAEKLSDLLTQSIERFVALVEGFVNNTPLSGTYTRPILEKPDSALKRPPTAGIMAPERTTEKIEAIALDDDFFKAESDFDTIRDDIISSNTFNKDKLTESTKVMIKKKSTDESAPKRPSTGSYTRGSTIAGRYEVLRHLGRGGMGSVYLVKDQILAGQEVAIKILYSEYVHQPGYMERFVREVQLLRRVNHPNVVRTFDVGVNDSLVYFTMEYVLGPSLATMLDKKALKPEQHLPLIKEICNGLQAIHESGIIHRDLTPGNILVCPDGTVKITDFGVARPEQSQFTMHKEILGSVAYIPPEVWLGAELTPSIDLYSLGVIVYEMTTGIIPFQGKSIPDTMRLHIQSMPQAPREINPAVPAVLNDLVMKLLAKRPEDRPANPQAVLAMIA